MESSEKSNKPKLKMAVYWGSACGGCCVSVLDVHEALFEVIDKADFVFWPIALDIKYKDVEEMPNGNIDITLFNGAIRNSENEHMAKLLREKSKLLIAYGSCAHLGGIPGLGNFHNREEIFERVYETTESTIKNGGMRPQTTVEVSEGKLHLPIFYDTVKTLDQVVCVDYYMPGCPPQTERLVEVFMAVVSGSELPKKESVIGAWDKTQCDECERIKTDNKSIKEFKRPMEIEDDHKTCFLEQGVICMGPSTRGGCDYRCIKGNAPCRGCYGPSPDISDPGSKMMSAIGTMVDANESDQIAEVVDQIVDPAGTFYRYSLPASIIRRKIL